MPTLHEQPYLFNPQDIPEWEMLEIPPGFVRCQANRASILPGEIVYMLCVCSEAFQQSRIASVAKGPYRILDQYRMVHLSTGEIIFEASGPRLLRKVGGGH
jgi:hypothetical protein